MTGMPSHTASAGQRRLSNRRSAGASSTARPGRRTAHPGGTLAYFQGYVCETATTAPSARRELRESRRAACVSRPPAVHLRGPLCMPDLSWKSQPPLKTSLTLSKSFCSGNGVAGGLSMLLLSSGKRFVDIGTHQETSCFDYGLLHGLLHATCVRLVGLGMPPPSARRVGSARTCRLFSSMVANIRCLMPTSVRTSGSR
jgi:hypothetical protein